jgi:predicted DCC family thiol-disulfide oxidoreductase YuxK
MSNLTAMKLTIFYDSQCPLCSAEINQLRSLDVNGKLLFEDLHAPDLMKRYPYIDMVHANRILHGQLEDGQMIYGLDVTCRAWAAVGKHRWLAVLRWPVIRWIADLFYLFFARYRNIISRLVVSGFKIKPGCSQCQGLSCTASDPKNEAHR